MQQLHSRGETVSVAETSSGGLISASLLSCALEPAGRDRRHTFAGAGVRLPRGLKDGDGKAVNDAVFKSWGVEYGGEEGTHAGTAVHALELAHAAKFNLDTDWGIGESGVPGPTHSSLTGFPPGTGFVAVVGPDEEHTGVLRIAPVSADGTDRMSNMARFARGALDLMEQLAVKGR